MGLDSRDSLVRAFVYSVAEPEAVTAEFHDDQPLAHQPRPFLHSCLIAPGIVNKPGAAWLLWYFRPRLQQDQNPSSRILSP